jgi:serine/threonine-protein kinase
VNHIDELGHLLVRREVITRQQWLDDRVGASRPEHFSAVLDGLAQMRAWWSLGGEFVPAINAFQRGRIEKELTAPKDYRRALRRVGRALRVNHYLLLQEFQGGMGIVFKAWSLLTKQFVAIKQVSQKTRDLAARLNREARILRRLNHRCIAGFHSFERARGIHLLVQEFVEGTTVSETVKKNGPLPWREAVWWTIDLLGALEYAHAQRVLHRDIKPSNLMLEPTRAGFMIRLLDLGLAKETGTADDLTGTGVVIGTKEYMSPEHSQGPQDIVPASDIYSLGCTLFFMLAGRPPFVFASEAVSPYVHAHASKPPPRVTEFNPEVPAALAELVQRMLRKEPARRGSPAKLREQLQRVLEGLPLGAEPPDQKLPGSRQMELADSCSASPRLEPQIYPRARFVDEEPVADAARLMGTLVLSLGQLIVLPLLLVGNSGWLLVFLFLAAVLLRVLHFI